jgi:hypothetical protein
MKAGWPLVEARTALINAVRGLTKSDDQRLPIYASYQVCEDLAGFGD